MALLDHLAFWRKSSNPESDGYGVFVDLMRRTYGSKAGVTITRDKALQIATVFACCRVQMDGVAQVPWKVMQKKPSPANISRHPQRHDAEDHAYFDVLYRQPNSWQTSFEFREQAVLHMGLGGRAYAYINEVEVMGRRYPELILLEPSRVTAEQAKDWSIQYKVRGRDGIEVIYPADKIWHLRGPSWDGFEGMEIFRLAREAMGLSAVLEDSHARMHKNGVKPSGTYSVEGALSEKQQKDLLNWLKEQAAADNVGNPLILDRGAKWISQSLSGVDAQHLETRRYQIEEICRFFRVLPIMVGYSDKTATFASAEAMFLAHVVHTLMPLYERIQQSADVNLLTREDRRNGYYTKLVEGGLMRGDKKTTAEYLARLVLAGVITRNEARALLDLNPAEGLDEPLTPTNMTNDPSGAVAQPSGVQA
jgi:HK97 family phage portal protein